jgi:hypothetical protein
VHRSAILTKRENRDKSNCSGLQDKKCIQLCPSEAAQHPVTTAMHLRYLLLILL